MEVDGQVHTAEQLGFSERHSLATKKVENPSHEVEIDKSKRDLTIDMWLESLDEKEEETKSSEPEMHIYKAPDLFQKIGLFQPRVVFLGPYHWSNNKEYHWERKRSMANRLIPNKMIQDEVRKEIKDKMEKLKAAFCKVGTTINPENWVDMLFLDGCFVLYFIICVMYRRAEDLKLNHDGVDLVHNDLFLLENQLPFELLKIISGKDSTLLRLIYDYICIHKLSNGLGRVLDLEHCTPVHLLDFLRTIIMGRRSEPKKRFIGHFITTFNNCMPNAKELTTRGIHLKPNRSGFLKDISFTSHFIYGTLKLPRITVDNSTKLLFLNMAAYEMSASKESAIISYICLLDSLVNHAEDIKELRTVGVLFNKLPTDEAAVRLFNKMSEELRPDSDTYLDVKTKMHRFFENKTKASLSSWVAEGYHNQFRSPLTAMAVLAAFIALCLAAIQTYFTVFH